MQDVVCLAICGSCEGAILLSNKPIFLIVIVNSLHTLAGVIQATCWLP